MIQLTASDETFKMVLHRMIMILILLQIRWTEAAAHTALDGEPADNLPIQHYDLEN
jgi:hypothetical protein